MSDAAIAESARRHALRKSAFNDSQMRNAYPRSTPSLKPVAVAQIERYQHHPERPMETKPGAETYVPAYDRQPSTSDSWNILIDNLLLWRKKHKLFVLSADENVPNAELDLMNETLQKLRTEMIDEEDILTRRESALARLQARVPEIKKIDISSKPVPDYDGRFVGDESLTESLSRLLAFLYGERFDGVNWVFPEESDKWREGDWGASTTVNVKDHPRYDLAFTEKLETPRG